MQGKVNNYPVWLYYNTRYKLRPKFESNEVLFLQYSQHGKVNGINGDVDLDLFLGDKESFNKISRRGFAGRIMKNIDLLLQHNFEVKINVVLIKGVNDHEVIDFIKWSGPFVPYK